MRYLKKTVIKALRVSWALLAGSIFVSCVLVGMYKAWFLSHAGPWWEMFAP